MNHSSIVSSFRRRAVQNRFWLLSGLALGLLLLAILGFGLAARVPPPEVAGNTPPLIAESPSAVREASREAPVLGVVVDARLRVLHVETGSAAEEAGIRAGDVLVSLGSTSLTGPGAGKGLVWQAMRAGQTMNVALVRDGRSLAVTAQPRPPKRWRGMPTPTFVPYDQYYF